MEEGEERPKVPVNTLTLSVDALVRMLAVREAHVCECTFSKSYDQLSRDLSNVLRSVGVDPDDVPCVGVGVHAADGVDGDDARRGRATPPRRRRRERHVRGRRGRRLPVPLVGWHSIVTDSIVDTVLCQPPCRVQVRVPAGEAHHEPLADGAFACAGESAASCRARQHRARARRPPTDGGHRAQVRCVWWPRGFSMMIYANDVCRRDDGGAADGDEADDDGEGEDGRGRQRRLQTNDGITAMITYMYDLFACMLL